MTGLKAILCIAALLCLAAFFVALPVLAQGSPATSPPDNAQGSDCRRLLEAMDAQKTLMLHETAQIKRELAAIRQELASPGLQELISGFGYIFGVAGIVLYLRCRGGKS